MAYLEPTEQPILYAATGTIGGEAIAVNGETRLGDRTGIAEVLDAVFDTDENAFIADVPADAWPALPDVGWLERGEIYAYDAQAVMVRQSHNRTIYPPEQTPALFIVYREDAAGMEWVAGEQVEVGTRRTYEGILYECRQAHVTQSDWTPPATPALWAVVQDPGPGNEWASGVAYTIGDVVTYEGAEYECRQSHTSQVGWEPPKVLALWLPI